jgi:acetate kinase
MKLLTINTGSSSLKAAVYDTAALDRPRLAVTIERIGHPDATLQLSAGAGPAQRDEQHALPDHAAAVAALLDLLDRHGAAADLAAIGHRIVHGGSRASAPQPIDDELLATLRDLSPIVPEHLPQAIAAIEATAAAYPAVPQIACFDTAFHRRMPPVAQRLPLPRRLTDAGVIRYGFHGLSYEYIMAALRQEFPKEAAGRVVIAHLGNGSSMAAVAGGISIETTMGFTPSGGLMMGTRAGDLDPGVLLHLLRVERLDAAALSRLINKESGLGGVSGTTGDMRELLADERDDPRAAEAIALYCYTAKKALGALAAALGGLDSVVFTGGIGERAAPVRERICAGLDFLGIALDPRRNADNAAIISQDGAATTVRVIPTDEDAMIARHTAALLAKQGGARCTIVSIPPSPAPSRRPRHRSYPRSPTGR